jgi:hypothetical protein
LTVRDPTTWVIWSVFLAALFGLALDPERLEMFRQCTGLTAPLLGGFNEAWLIVGRRGKSIILALIAVFLAVFKDWSDRLVPGERGTVLVIAADRRQARVIFRYVTALITETPLIAGLVDGEVTQDRINLTNGITIEISTAILQPPSEITHRRGHRAAARGYLVVGEGSWHPAVTGPLWRIRWWRRLSARVSLPANRHGDPAANPVENRGRKPRPRRRETDSESAAEWKA